MARLLLVAFDAAEAVQGRGFAQSLALAFDLLCLTGEGPADLGAEKVFNAGLGEVPPADGLAKELATRATGYSHIAAVSSMRSKDVMARVAALLDAAMITDALSAESQKVFKRPMVAGSVIATVEA